MALWKENPTPAPAGSSVPTSATALDRSGLERSIGDSGLAVSPRRPTPKTAVEGGESVIASGLSAAAVVAPLIPLTGMRPKAY